MTERGSHWESQLTQAVPIHGTLLLPFGACTVHTEGWVQRCWKGFPCSRRVKHWGGVCFRQAWADQRFPIVSPHAAHRPAAVPSRMRAFVIFSCTKRAVEGSLLLHWEVALQVPCMRERLDESEATPFNVKRQKPLLCSTIPNSWRFSLQRIVFYPYLLGS